MDVADTVHRLSHSIPSPLLLLLLRRKAGHHLGRFGQLQLLPDGFGLQIVLAAIPDLHLCAVGAVVEDPAGVGHGQADAAVAARAFFTLWTPGT